MSDKRTDIRVKVEGLTRLSMVGLSALLNQREQAQKRADDAFGVLQAVDNEIAKATADVLPQGVRPEQIEIDRDGTVWIRQGMRALAPVEAPPAAPVGAPARGGASDAPTGT